MEYILKELEEKSDAAVGWNPHCIINAIETLVNGEDWLKPCDIQKINFNIILFFIFTDFQ